ncbi:nitrilase-related carbon-nitrogen hydrolase [Nocardia sp. NPDC052001]|uniref:carbon-nitrogen hydrolase family protein n=1 Tax=Nocardia sp. NPDC052001 TaxID=3154853 RepID=UPI003418BE3F
MNRYEKKEYQRKGILMKIAIIQHLPELDYPIKERLERACARIESLADQNIDLIMLPEEWLDGAFMDDIQFAEQHTLDGWAFTRIGESVRRVGAYVHAGTFQVKNDDGGLPFNTAIFFAPNGEIRTRYDKIHLHGKSYATVSPEDKARYLGGASEVHKAEPQTNGSTLVVETVVLPHSGREVTFGFNTCADITYGEQQRALVDMGADVLLLSAAWPTEYAHAWDLLPATRALENCVFVLAANNRGHQEALELYGNSMVINPFGRVIARAGKTDEILIAELDLDEVKAANIIGGFKQDRAVAESYAGKI